MQRLSALLVLAVVALAGQALAQDKTIELKEATVSVLGATGKVAVTRKGNYPEQLLQNPQIPAQHSLEVQVPSITSGGEAFKPQQVMLQLEHVKTGALAFAVGKAKGSAYTLTTSLAAIEKQIGKLAGEYKASLLVGDPSVEKGVQWALGKVELVVAPGEAVDTPQVRTASLQPTGNPKPTIVHTFRQPDKRAPAFIALVFSGLALLPLGAVAVYVLFVLKVNFNGFPKEGTTSMAALAFHGLLGAMLLVYLLFWTRWNLADTLPRVLLLSVPLAVAGHRLLSGLSASRIKRE